MPTCPPVSPSCRVRPGGRGPGEIERVMVPGRASRGTRKQTCLAASLAAPASPARVPGQTCRWLVAAASGCGIRKMPGQCWSARVQGAARPPARRPAFLTYCGAAELGKRLGEWPRKGFLYFGSSCWRPGPASTALKVLRRTFSCFTLQNLPGYIRQQTAASSSVLEVHCHCQPFMWGRRGHLGRGLSDCSAAATSGLDS